MQGSQLCGLHRTLSTISTIMTDEPVAMEGMWTRKVKEEADSLRTSQRTGSEPCRGWEGRAQLSSKFFVWLYVWLITKIDEHRKSVLGRQGYVINSGHLKVRTASPCVGVLQLFRTVGVYPYFINEDIERSESLWNFLRFDLNQMYATLPPFLTFLSVNNGRTASQEGVWSSFMSVSPWKGCFFFSHKP